jgi:hypothetical protein
MNFKSRLKGRRPRGANVCAVIPKRRSGPSATMIVAYPFGGLLSLSIEMGIPPIPQSTAECHRFYYPSFPLDCAGWLGGDVIDDAVDALDLVDDARRRAAKEIVGEVEIVGRHAIG